MRAWSSICCVTNVELVMLTPLSTITTQVLRSTPVVKRLPLIVWVRFDRVCATSRSASAPKAETMPMRGVQSVRQRAGAAWAAMHGAASAHARAMRTQ